MTPAAAAAGARRAIESLRAGVDYAELTEVERAAPDLLPVIARLADGLGRVATAGRPGAEGQSPNHYLHLAGARIDGVAQRTPVSQLIRRSLRSATAPLQAGPRGNARTLLEQARQAEDATNLLQSAARPDIRVGTDPAAMRAILPDLTGSCDELGRCTRMVERALHRSGDSRASDLDEAVTFFEKAGDSLRSRAGSMRRGRFTLGRQASRGASAGTSERPYTLSDRLLENPSFWGIREMRLRAREAREGLGLIDHLPPDRYALRQRARREGRDARREARGAQRD
jgi:hypothetical protein